MNLETGPISADRPIESPAVAAKPGGKLSPRATPVLEPMLARSRWSLLWERLWPALALPAVVVGVFLSLSWIGLWLQLPPAGRLVGIALFGLLLVAALIPLVRLRLPTRAEAVSRLDRQSGLVHRPATAATDSMATPGSDPWAGALWQAHVTQSLAAARFLRSGWPSPRLVMRDPVALRALVLIAVIATFFAAGGDRMRRITAAFDWTGVVTPANFRLDAWVSPPVYTGRPPMMLQGMRPGEMTAAADTAPLSVPSGSILVVRASGDAKFDVVTSGGLAAASPSADSRSPLPAGAEERRYTINGSGTATLRGVGRDLVWSFEAVSDQPPVIALAKDPEQQSRGALQLSYKLEDDYGVVDARATFAAKPATEGDTPRALFEPPEIALVLPQARTRTGVGQTIKDLTENPWAGADVIMTLTARDEAKNEGRSEPFALRLPERVFLKPLARALIEQRRTLALDAETRDHVLIAIDALAMAPEQFTPEAGTYIGLRAIYWMLARAKSDDDLREVVNELWAMATQLEDGDVSSAEAQLRAAQERLRQALERGASEEEIKRLMDELRAALDKFLQTLAEEMRKNPQMARPLDRNMRALRSQDLRSMLDRLEQMARSGARDAARAMLDQLQSMLENLQMARPGMPGDDDMMSALDELGDMIRRQQQLRDQTFREGQDRRGQRGQQRREGQQQGRGLGELRQDQQALRERLKQLMEQLRKNGLGQQSQDGQQGQQGQQGQGNDPLGRAGDAMGDAAESLGQGNSDSAVDSQGRALDALRKGAQGLAQQLEQQMGRGPGQGQPTRLGRGRADQDTDPFGRPLRGREYGDDSTVKVPGEIDIQRARRILEELRRRFADPLRPMLELDYIERLLKDY
ncbi:MAG: TIGR02302 family protein [Xanthobacteraceae bacterium]